MYGNSVSNGRLNVLRAAGVQKKGGFGHSTLYNMINPASKYYDPTFPKPIRLGAGSVGWVEAEVDAWIASRMQQRASV